MGRSASGNCAASGAGPKRTFEWLRSPVERRQCNFYGHEDRETTRNIHRLAAGEAIRRRRGERPSLAAPQAYRSAARRQGARAARREGRRGARSGNRRSASGLCEQRSGARRRRRQALGRAASPRRDLERTSAIGGLRARRRARGEQRKKARNLIAAASRRNRKNARDETDGRNRF